MTRVETSVATALSLLSVAADMQSFLGGNVAQQDVILWNCLIGKYARNWLLGEAMKFLQQIKLEGLKPNSSTLVGLLSGCPASGSMHVVRYVTSFTEEEKLELDAVLGAAPVDAYAKCGFLDKATDIFERMKGKDM
ncbi:pentatricopeptide repeat-containing protein At1g26900, mitochondrial-like [Arachis hypogaea]|uniref:pentatricopeptide repeat-containing protein At1g26900, mitochondrial-like n=1 Tax=Arachis hypogaea TaxID=3818 RepID=UPI001105717A|nr:pentatricopeptide repeat-containing protein At1g26900, mitochondrial-like [Arachis hypogaea]